MKGRWDQGRMKVGLGRAGQGVGGGREQLGEVSQAGKQDTHG